MSGEIQGSGDRQLDMVKGIRKAFKNDQWDKVERGADGKIHDVSTRERGVMQKLWSFLKGDGWK